MDSELIYCPYCRSEYMVYYGDNWKINQDSIVSETSCKCKKKIVDNEKILDKAFEILKKQGILK